MYINKDKTKILILNEDGSHEIFVATKITMSFGLAERAATDMGKELAVATPRLKWGIS